MEVIQGKGYSLFPEEEMYRTKLENMQRELNKPTQFKGTTYKRPNPIQALRTDAMLILHDSHTSGCRQTTASQAC
jgi:hypothetical protein